MHPYTYAEAPVAVSARAAFLRRTYAHLLGAIALFVALQFALFSSGLAEDIARTMLSVNWLFVLGGFVAVSWVATRVVSVAESRTAQYAALGAFVLAQALIFVPLLVVAAFYAGPATIPSAALITTLGFLGLTGIAFQSGKDFSFLGGLLKWGFVVAIALIVGGVVFGFQLGVFFSAAMVGLAGAAILYDTSRILRDYPEDRHVAAALQLFASVALMFYYVLMLLTRR
ncbi:MAG: Bax inhibitor-1 family protein [Rubricoccaceae bacterium]